MLHFRPSPRANNGATEYRHLLSWCTLAVAALALIAARLRRRRNRRSSLAEALKLAVARSQQLASQRSMVDAAREMAGPQASCRIRSSSPASRTSRPRARTPGR